MYRVKCAHCGAGNQNVNEMDTCFQCGMVLGEATAPRSTFELYPLAATIDLSKVSPDQLPPRILPPGLASATQRSIAIAAAAAFLSVAVIMGLMITLIR
jgi:hypothetical protein